MIRTIWTANSNWRWRTRLSNNSSVCAREWNKMILNQCVLPCIGMRTINVWFILLLMEKRKNEIVEYKWHFFFFRLSFILLVGVIWMFARICESVVLYFKCVAQVTLSNDVVNDLFSFSLAVFFFYSLWVVNAQRHHCWVCRVCRDCKRLSMVWCIALIVVYIQFIQIATHNINWHDKK